MKNWHKGTLQNIIMTFAMTVSFGCIACLTFRGDQQWLFWLTTLVAAISIRLCFDQIDRFASRKKI